MGCVSAVVGVGRVLTVTELDRNMTDN